MTTLNYGPLVQFHVLGPVRVSHDGEDLPLGGPQQRLVLALLIAARGRVLTIGQLIFALDTSGALDAERFEELAASALALTSVDDAGAAELCREFDTACEAAGRNMTRAEWDLFGPRDTDYRATCARYPIEA